MLDQIETMFKSYEFMIDMKSKNKEPLLKKKGRKEIYEYNMESFRSENGRFFTEMTELMAASQEKEAMAGKLSQILVEAVEKTYLTGSRFGRSRRIADLNFFMVYYVFPAILLTGQEDAMLLCDTLRDTWNFKFHEQIGYTDYDTIRSGFNEKILGFL